METGLMNLFTEPTAVSVLQVPGQESRAQYGSALHVFIASARNVGLADAVAARTLGI